MIFFKGYKINKTVNKIFLERDKFMPEMHLEQPSALDKPEPAGKYWPSGCSEDNPLQRPRTSPKDPV